MSLQHSKTHRKENNAIARSSSQNDQKGIGKTVFEDNRAGNITQLQEQANTSPLTNRVAQLQAIANNYTQQQDPSRFENGEHEKSEVAEPIQKKSNIPTKKTNRTSNVVQRVIGVGGANPKGFKELTAMFVTMAKGMGGEQQEIMKAFDTDKNMHLYFYAFPKPEKEAGLEGLTLPAIKVASGWKYNWNLGDDDWNTLSKDVELRIEIHVHYSGKELDKDTSKHFYTMLHEFAVHAKPFYNVFKNIRLGIGPKTKEKAAEMGGNSKRGHHHDDIAMGNNTFYEDMYKKVLDHIRALEIKGANTKGVNTKGLVDQHDIDQYTQTLHLVQKLLKTAREDSAMATSNLQQAPSKETYMAFHNTMKKHSDALRPLKEKIDNWTMMFEMWPQLVKVFEKKDQFEGSGEMYLKLLPLIKNLQKGITENYNHIHGAYLKTVEKLQANQGN